jgi:hypothetical protein
MIILAKEHRCLTEVLDPSFFQLEADFAVSVLASPVFMMV